MLRITEDPSSGSLVQCLAKNYKNGSIVPVDMEKVGVMAAYSDPLCVCVVHCIRRHTGYLYIASFTFSNSTFCPHSVFVCLVWISEQTTIISPYSINWLVSITETECVYCTVRAEN